MGTPAGKLPLEMGKSALTDDVSTVPLGISLYKSESPQARTQCLSRTPTTGLIGC